MEKIKNILKSIPKKPEKSKEKKISIEDIVAYAVLGACFIAFLFAVSMVI